MILSQNLKVFLFKMILKEEEEKMFDDVLDC